MIAAQILRNLIAAVPYTIHTDLTENGIQFTNRKQDQFAFEHIFSRVCRENGIDQRLTKVNHPWTKGQVERMNRTIKEATVKRYHYDTHSQLETHLTDFIAAYNYAHRFWPSLATRIRSSALENDIGAVSVFDTHLTY